MMPYAFGVQRGILYCLGAKIYTLVSKSNKLSTEDGLLTMPRGVSPAGHGNDSQKTKQTLLVIRQTHPRRVFRGDEEVLRFAPCRFTKQYSVPPPLLHVFLFAESLSYFPVNNISSPHRISFCK